MSTIFFMLLKSVGIKMAIWVIFGALPDWSSPMSVQSFFKRNVRTLQAIVRFTPWVMDDVTVDAIATILNDDRLFKSWWGETEAIISQENVNIDNSDYNSRPILRVIRSKIKDLIAKNEMNLPNTPILA